MCDQTRLDPDQVPLVGAFAEIAICIRIRSTDEAGMY